MVKFARGEQVLRGHFSSFPISASLRCKSKQYSEVYVGPLNSLWAAKSAQGQTAKWLAGEQMSGNHPEPDPRWTRWFVAYVPCVDGSPLARAFFTFAALVGAAMCSACLRGSHDRWP